MHAPMRRHTANGDVLLLTVIPSICLQLPGPLAHLGCNGLDLYNFDSTCAPHLTSLEVNYSIYSLGMLKHILPAIKELRVS